MATKRTARNLIEDFRAGPANAERGEKFERLMVDYVFLDATSVVEYDEVKRWPDWDHRQRTHDSGIDLFARNEDTGETVAKSDIDSLLTASGKRSDGVTFTSSTKLKMVDALPDLPLGG